MKSPMTKTLGIIAGEGEMPITVMKSAVLKKIPFVVLNISKRKIRRKSNIKVINLAKLVRKHQPKLFDYVYRLRQKQKVQTKIDLDRRKPVLHVSATYSSRLGCLALVMPICVHPQNNNGIIVYDLREDPDNWMGLYSDEINSRVYTSTDQLAKGVNRVPLSTVYVNRCPVVASPAVLEPNRASLYELDIEACREHWRLMQSTVGIGNKIRDVFKLSLIHI